MRSARRTRGGREEYLLHSSCGVWAVSVIHGRVGKITLPPSPPRPGSAFEWRAARNRIPGAPPVLGRFMSEVRRYFSGAPVTRRIPVAPERVTVFRARVWGALRRIPYGRVASYGGIARLIGVPGGSRAVGNACGANPLPILVPCHRVVAARGIGGFSSGPRWKRFLLAHEARD
ncbi:MAG: methylated-DNA--[protein]-cysteine S-methyltransferase [Candidatus Aureabacteria bacterium]|nr:methylated-DNA--[protein]-cysteine S-methyltransferase [Candidatus Auribacterota bacterium]